MLITNFASGELSENLFGRIDMPQYFQGVSHLENFDVVPTGGISRRRGTRRILGLPEEGRIIPFIIDRDTHILLFLSPGKISVIVDGVITSTVESTEELPLYATMAEIDEVQYAQNFDVMVLVHKGYAPIAIILGVNNSIFISKFYIDCVIEEVNEPGVEKTGTDRFDDNYKSPASGGKGWLTTPENYPISVTFFNSRIIFAGTQASPQRIFASRSGEIHIFSTKKIYRSETREYITVDGVLNLSDNTIRLTDLTEIGKFNYPPGSYFINSQYYDEDTGILGLFGDKLYINSNPKTITISEETIEAVAAWAADINSSDTGSEYYKICNRTYMGLSMVPVSTEGDFYFSYFAGKIRIRFYRPYYGTEDIWDVTISISDAKSILSSYTYFVEYINAVISTFNIEFHTLYFSDSQKSAFIAGFWDYIQDKMKLAVSAGAATKTFYGSPTDIYNQVSQNSIIDVGLITSIFTLYVKIPIEDEYTTPDDGFTFEIASDMSDAIKWIGQNKNLLVGTETAEWIIPAGVNATNIQAILNSRYGSDNVQGTAIGDAFCFIQTGRKAIVEYYIPQQDNNFRANNMAMTSKNMLNESPVFDFDFQSAPYTRIFISRADGKVACLLYERMTGTFAWGRITTSGHIRSVAVLPGGGQDEVYFVVERGAGFFLERLDNRNEVYLDGFHEGALEAGEIQAGEYSGFPYTSRVRSMPVLANDKMKNNVIKTLNIRFHDSCLPKVKSIAGDREVQTDTITRKEPYSGIIQIPFPGQYDRDVFFEFVHDKPTACHILAVHAEAT
jgi:hypothetical protein